MKKKPSFQILRQETHSETLYDLETTAHLAAVSATSIRAYCQKGLVSPAAESAQDRLLFDDDSVYRIRRIREFREKLGVNLNGAKLILEMHAEIEQLRRELRFWRR